MNALAQQACFRDAAGRDRSREITRDAVHTAREQLILRRETHLEQLTDKLSEERVRRVMGPVLSSGQANPEMRPDDLQYVRDLGLVARDDPIRIANPIYREVIPRDLTWTTQAGCEYGLGRMRTDLLILWPAGAPPDRARRMVIECKLLRHSLEETILTGLEQTRSYMDRCAAAEGAAAEGHLVIFDRTADKPWREKLLRRTESAGGIPITVWGM